MAESRFEPLGLGVGTLLNGRYDIVRKLGSGGMSAVYQVIDRAINNDSIALKLFDPRLMADPKQLERFRNEVQITRKLTHPNIVRTYDFGEVQGKYYFMTMEHLHGVTLEKLIGSKLNGGLSFEECLKILVEILKGIAYAHKSGIVHRDLKPANILISENGDVKISDFGLARAENSNLKLTQVGECVGTPYYMAPEQIQEQAIDGRVDLYAIGIIAYELIAGYVPFTDESWFHLATRIIKEPLPALPKKKRPAPWFQDFVNKATAKRREDRFSSAEEMLQLIESYMTGDLDETQAQTPFVGDDTSQLPIDADQTARLPLAYFRGAVDRQFEDTMQLPLGIARWSRFAPFVLLASLIALTGIAMAGFGTKSVDNVAENFKASTGMLADFTNTLGKLQQVVVEIDKNKDSINRFLDDQKAAPQNDSPEPTGVSDEVTPAPSPGQ